MLNRESKRSKVSKEYDISLDGDSLLKGLENTMEVPIRKLGSIFVSFVTRCPRG